MTQTRQLLTRVECRAGIEVGWFRQLTSASVDVADKHVHSGRVASLCLIQHLLIGRAARQESTQAPVGTTTQTGATHTLVVTRGTHCS
jgi:hypothetical protein